MCWILWFINKLHISNSYFQQMLRKIYSAEYLPFYTGHNSITNWNSMQQLACVIDIWPKVLMRCLPILVYWRTSRMSYPSHLSRISTVGHISYIEVRKKWIFRIFWQNNSGTWTSCLCELHCTSKKFIDFLIHFIVAYLNIDQKRHNLCRIKFKCIMASKWILWYRLKIDVYIMFIFISFGFVAAMSHRKTASLPVTLLTDLGNKKKQSSTKQEWRVNNFCTVLCSLIRI